MTKEEDFKLLKIQTCVLKVNIHCDGCKQKVKKLLQRIEGVYQVQIDAEQQKVTVLGSVEAATLIKKLVRAGKHAELWSSQKANQNQKQKNNCIKDDKNKGQKQGGLAKGIEAFRNQQKFPAFFSEEDDECYDEDEDEFDDEMRIIREKANHLSYLRQQAAAEANNAKKGAAIPSVQNNGKMINNVAIANASGGKKGNPNQSMGMKVNPAGLDPKTIAALKMNNPHFGGGENFNLGESKRANDIGTMMNLAGFNGNGGNGGHGGSATVLGSNLNGLGGFQAQQPNSGIAGSSGLPPNGAFSNGQYPASMLTNMNGINNHPSQLMNMNMNMQNRHVMQQQPQMMYHRSPFVPPSTGYYYNYSHSPACYPYSLPNYYEAGDHSAAHMFSDENTSSSCSIM